MNPFTKSLVERLDDAQVAAFVGRWDALEALVIRIFRANEAKAADAEEFGEVQAGLRRVYPCWEAALEPHWRPKEGAETLTRTDPFRSLFEASSAEAFVDNWDAMQTLPAAREALNSLLVEMIEDSV